MNEEHLMKLRHSLAHLLAAAVLEHYPDAKPTIGPATDEGFYYDFDFGDKKISEEDLKKIHKSMKKLLPSWTSFERTEVSADDARKTFKDNLYKLELIEEIEKEGETITFYTSGDFTDLCRGGHIDNPSEEIDPDAFELDRIAGAYWRGDEKNTMLTRIYGLAFESREALQAYKTQREEAKERDHRKLGKELDLFTFSELVGPGLPLWTPKGTLMRDLIIEKIQSLQKNHGYSRVTIPHITKKELYETSGHWSKFGDELFKVKGAARLPTPAQGNVGQGDGDFDFVMKPMNCPHHTQIYAAHPRSYRDLPVRYLEATTVYRDEQAGELLGLARTRAFTQDDGHVFCTIEQVKDECENIADVIEGFYSSLGMWKEGEFEVSLSVRDPKNLEKYLGKEENWNKAEKLLEEIAEDKNLPYTRVEGEAAFYGPKLDFMFRDALGRKWQLATIQLDFAMPERFGLTYTDEHGKEETPVMIHRAIAGSLERFMSVMIEHFKGAFPLWLSPVQVKILPIGEGHQKYAQEVREILHNAGVRVEVDDSANTLGKRIRNVKVEKVPYFLVIGDVEVDKKEVTVESRDEGKIGEMSVEGFIEHLKKGSS